MDASTLSGNAKELNPGSLSTWRSYATEFTLMTYPYHQLPLMQQYLAEFHTEWEEKFLPFSIPFIYQTNITISGMKFSSTALSFYYPRMLASWSSYRSQDFWGEREKDMERKWKTERHINNFKNCNAFHHLASIPPSCLQARPFSSLRCSSWSLRRLISTNCIVYSLLLSNVQFF